MAEKKAQRSVRTPRTWRTEKELCQLPRDNWTVGDYWILVGNGGNGVVLCHQKRGAEPTGSVEIPRRVFDRFVDWYNTGSTRKRKAATR